jgi:hypothetical protein
LCECGFQLVEVVSQVGVLPGLAFERCIQFGTDPAQLLTHDEAVRGDGEDVVGKAQGAPRQRKVAPAGRPGFAEAGEAGRQYRGHGDMVRHEPELP